MTNTNTSTRRTCVPKWDTGKEASTKKPPQGSLRRDLAILLQLFWFAALAMNHSNLQQLRKESIGGPGRIIGPCLSSVLSNHSPCGALLQMVCETPAQNLSGQNDMQAMLPCGGCWSWVFAGAPGNCQVELTSQTGTILIHDRVDNVAWYVTMLRITRILYQCPVQFQ